MDEICISMTTNEAEHLFMFLTAIRVSSLEKIVFIFFTWLFVLFLSESNLLWGEPTFPSGEEFTDLRRSRWMTQWA